MTLAQGDDFAWGSVGNYQQFNRLKNHFRGADVPSNIQPGMLFSRSSDDKMFHRGASANEEMLQLTRSKDVNPQFNEPDFRGLNIVTDEGEVVVDDDGEVVFDVDF